MINLGVAFIFLSNVFVLCVNMNGKYRIASGAFQVSRDLYVIGTSWSVQDVPYNDDYASKGYEYFDIYGYFYINIYSEYTSTL